MKSDLTHAELLRRLSYDAETGAFSSRRTGAAVGSVDDMGYVRITFGRGRRHRAHRLAWFYVTGSWPSADIDHIDGNRANNSFANLRDVPRIVNTQNRKAENPLNKSSGLIGAVWSRAARKWASRIRTGGGRFVDLGLFETADAAHRAYVCAKRQLHEGCTL